MAGAILSKGKNSRVDAAFAWGVNGHPISQEAYRQVPLSTQLQLMTELGIGWYRCDFGETNFHKYTARMDELVQEAMRQNIRLLPILFASPGAKSSTATPEQIRSASMRFAKEIVTRYRGKITHWELTNELDGYAMIRKGETTRKGKLWPGGAPDGSSPEDYEENRYQKAKAEIEGLNAGVKAADPNALTMVDAGWLHYGFMDRLIREDRVPFDILAWHWYSDMGDITKVRGKLDMISLLKRYQKPLWITEIDRKNGSKSDKEKDQAQYISQTAAQFGNHPDIEAYFLYELLDQPYFGDSGEAYYGLVELARNGKNPWEVRRKKPAFEVYRAAIAAIKRK